MSEIKGLGYDTLKTEKNVQILTLSSEKEIKIGRTR
jgi:hypothetical protein